MSTDHAPTDDSPLTQILNNLGLKPEDLEPCAGSSGVRIQFENNFTVELDQQSNGHCRISARLSRLASSLHTQDIQVIKALEIYAEVMDKAPSHSSLAISLHDNCLRQVIDLTPTRQKTREDTLRDFDHFVQFAYAFKRTYLALNQR